MSKGLGFLLFGAAVLIVAGVFFFGRYSAKKYTVDYDGAKGMYIGAEDSYAAGTKVVLYYPYVATDTDYSFYLDGKRLDFDYDDNKGFVLKFVMPDHDVVLSCKSKNTMIYEEPDTEN